jgi:hypothetical protein
MSTDGTTDELPEWGYVSALVAWAAKDLFIAVCDWCVGCCLPVCGELRPEMLEALRAVASFKSCSPDGTLRGQAEWRAELIRRAAPAVAKMIADGRTVFTDGWELEELDYVRERLEHCVWAAEAVAVTASSHDRAVDELFNPEGHA